MSIRNLEILIITGSQVSQSEMNSNATFQAVNSGGEAANVLSVFDSVSLTGSSPEQGGSYLQDSLNVFTYPSVLFIDVDNNTVLARLTSNITANRVKELIQFLDSLQKDSTGRYIRPSGEIWSPFGGDTGGFGFGFTLPWWMFAIVAIIAGVKAGTGKKTSTKIAWSAVGLYAGINTARAYKN